MNKKIFGITIWFLLGLSSTILGWTHFVSYVIGTYVWYAFVEGNLK